MAYAVMAHIVMTYIGSGLYRYGLQSYGQISYPSGRYVWTDLRWGMAPIFLVGFFRADRSLISRRRVSHRHAVGDGRLKAPAGALERNPARARIDASPVLHAKRG